MVLYSIPVAFDAASSGYNFVKSVWNVTWNGARINKGNF